jgi:RNA-directed DNA polymerase
MSVSPSFPRAFLFSSIEVLRARHGWNWGQLRRHLKNGSGRWVIAAGGVEYFRLQSVTVSRYAYRGNKIPNPWSPANPA